MGQECDILGYHLLAFKILEDNLPFGYHYIICTVFPNWESRLPEPGEIGYLQCDEVIGGIDTYYDRDSDSIVKYRYTNIIFKKFVKKVDNSKKEIII